MLLLARSSSGCPAVRQLGRQQPSKLRLGALVRVSSRRQQHAMEPAAADAAATSPPPSAAAAADAAADADAAAYSLAAERLQELLAEADLTNKGFSAIDLLDQCTPPERLTLVSNLGSLVMCLAIAAMFVFADNEPLGFMRLDAATAHAAAYGAAFAVPLVACSAASRAPAARRAFPVLHDMHAEQAELAAHLVDGMTPFPQVAILLTFLVLPATLLALPLVDASLSWAGEFAQQRLLATFADLVRVRGLSLPLCGDALLPLLASAWLGGVGAATLHAVPQYQLAALRDALRSADGYFRLAAARRPQQEQAATSQRRAPAPPAADAPLGAPPTVFASLYTDGGSLYDGDDGGDDDDCKSPSSSGSGGRPAADAFRAVTALWLLSRRRVARLAFLLGGLNAAYLGATYEATGNLATPLSAALLHAASELALGQWQRRAALAARRHSTGAGGGRQ